MMQIKKQIKRHSAAALLLGALVCGIRPGAFGAETGTPAAAQSIPTATVPDVQIVVSPDPSGQWVIAAVYPSKTDRRKAESRAKEMLTLGKWKGNGLLFENRALERTENPKGMAPPPMMSSVTLSTPGNIVNYAEKTRCPVSAACKPTFIVSMSRISPIRMMSGFWRTTYFRASVKESVSIPISRCETMLLLSG